MQWVMWLFCSIFLGLIFQSSPLFFTVFFLGIIISIITSSLRHRIQNLQEQQDQIHLRLNSTEKWTAQQKKNQESVVSVSSELSTLQQQVVAIQQENRELRALLRAVLAQQGTPLETPPVLSIPEVSETPEPSAQTTISAEPSEIPEMAMKESQPLLTVSPETSQEPLLVENRAEVSSDLGVVASVVSVHAAEPVLSSQPVVEQEVHLLVQQPEVSVGEAKSKLDVLDVLDVLGTTEATKQTARTQKTESPTFPEKSPTVRATSFVQAQKNLRTEPKSSSRDEESWESFIGSKLLTYVGIAILVLGLVSLLTYSLTQMGPLGRCLTGVGCGLVLLATGFFLEPREKYTLYGRIVMGGGWSVLYFTAYGAYHIAAMKVIQTPVLGTSVMAVVAVGMLLHSLHYRSESTTGVALLLSYITLFVSPVSLYTHVAGLILGILIGFFAYRWRWVVTHLVGVVLLYGGYGTWLFFQGPKSLPTHQTEYLLASIFLVGLWAIFKAPDFSKPSDDRWEQYLVPIIGLLNLLGLAVVRKITHHVFKTHGAPATALYLGLIYIVICQILRWRGRDRVYHVDASVGVVLVLVGLWCLIVPYHTTMLSWMAVGVMVFCYSLYRNDRYFRDLGHLTLAVSILLVLGGEWPKEIVRWFYQVVSGEMLLEIKHTALPNKIMGSPMALGITGAIGASVMFLGSWLTFLLLRRQQQEFSVSEETRDRILVFFSTITMMWSLFLCLQPWACAVAWSVLGFLLFLYGLYRQQFILRAWSHLVLGWTLASGDLLGLSRLHLGLSMGFSGLLLLFDGYMTLRLDRNNPISEQEALLEKFLVVGGTTALVLAASILFAPFAMLVAWLILALVLFFYGYHRGDRVGRWCAYVLHIFTTGYGCCFLIFNQDIITVVGAWKASRFVFVVLLATALSYSYAALIHVLWKTHDDVEPYQEEQLLVSVGNLSLVITGWYALPAITVALAYALTAILWLKLALRWQRKYLRIHASFLLVLSSFWLFTVNMNALGVLLRIPRRILSSVPVIGLLAYAGMIWQQLRTENKKDPDMWEAKLPALFSVINFSAIQVLLYYHAYFSGLGWMLHGLVLFVLLRWFLRPWYSLLGLIATSMSSVALVSLALRHIGDPWTYVLQYPVLLFGPCLLFVAHLWSKWLLPAPSAFVAVDRLMESSLVALTSSLKTILGFLFCTVLLAILTILLPAQQLSLGWGIAGFFLGWYGLSGQEKFFRWIALALFGVAVGKILLVDIFHFSTAQKIITFISVGLALLFISFLYNRFKDKLADLLLKD